MANTKDMAALNDALHQQLNRLNAPGLDEKGLNLELQRTEAMTEVSKQIINNGRLLLDAAQVRDKVADLDGVPKILQIEKKDVYSD